MNKMSGQTPEDYGIGISIQILQNRLTYLQERSLHICPKCRYCDTVQEYVFCNNAVLTKDRHFVALQNACDVSRKDIFREDMDVGGTFTLVAKHYINAGISMDKWKSYKPCVRYGLIHIASQKLSIPEFKDNLDFIKTAANLLISGINMILSKGYKWTYETRANVLWSTDRWEYCIDNATRIYILKNFGYEACGSYARYNNLDMYIGKVSCFVDF